MTRPSGGSFAWRLDDSLIVAPPPPPGSANLQLDFDANQPGAGNVPNNLGLYSSVGLLSLNGSGVTYQASGGPNGNAAWNFTGTGFYEDASYATIGTGDWTLAMLVYVNEAPNQRLMVAASVSASPYLGVTQVTGTTYRLNTNGGSVAPASAITKATQWDVVVGRFNSSTVKFQTFHGALGDASPTAGTDTATTDTNLGARVELGGSFAAGEHNGKITRAMAWDALVSAQDILDYLNGEYG